MSRRVIFWGLCVSGTLIATVFVAARMVVGGDRGMLPIGETTDAHHQIEMACETCHAAPAFAGAAAAVKAMNKTCRNCHEDELKTAGDSHRSKRFRSPRMAVYRERIDARLCTACHVEHRPEITRAGAVTVPMDFCVACHAEGEQDVRADRPSHAGLTFDTCASAGCHNYHDNSALYEDFLVKHAGQPWVAPEPVHARSAQLRTRELSEEGPLTEAPAIARSGIAKRPRQRSPHAWSKPVPRPPVALDGAPAIARSGIAKRPRQRSPHAWSTPVPRPPVALDGAPAIARSGIAKRPPQRSPVAPAAALVEPAALDDWAGSGHAAAGVNCAACHAPDTVEGAPRAEVEARWIEAPDTGVCEDCHKPQARTFIRGRHGMRGHPSIAAPRDPKRGLKAIGLGGVLPGAVAAWFADPPRPARMTVAEARLPMRAEAAHQSLDCGTCHRPHAVDTERAAVEACASCHDDTHTRAWFGSAHHALWQAELAGEAPPGAGVSCATCHMAKVGRRGKIVTNHNQNDVLRPNEKMIRSVCLDCHGLGFALDALADADLVARNFKGKPSVHVESIEWAVRRSRGLTEPDRMPSR